MRTSSLSFALAFLLAACSPVAHAPMQGAQKSSDNESSVTLTWVFTPTRTGANDQPFTNVSLAMSGSIHQTIALGEFSGTCSQESPEQVTALGKDTLNAALCWFAGGGDEFIVRLNASNLQVLHRTVDEGNPDKPAAPQQFKNIGNAVTVPIKTRIVVPYAQKDQQ